MMQTRISFDVVKGSHAYTCPCSGCGKTLRRTATVEHTVNPFNKTDEGEVKTRQQVYFDARDAAKAEAKRLEGVAGICRDCEDAPNRALLLEMAADPTKVFPQPPNFWRSPMYVLQERGHVDYVHQKCDCGSACCSGYVNNPGLRITGKGRDRAASLKAKMNLEIPA